MIEDFLAGDGPALVEAALRQASADEVMPRWRQLEAHEIAEKRGPYDLVTVADQGAERHLARSLGALLPGSVVVGEEGVSEDPELLAAVGGDAPVWIVDPVDGTWYFAHGEQGFAMLVALAYRGEVVASWTYAPAHDVMAVAVRGGGARVDGELVSVGARAPGADLTVATSSPQYISDAEHRRLLRLETPGVARRNTGSAGLEYLRIARGELDAVAYTWENPWDHAAGLLLVTEAGGVHRTAGGVPFRVTGGNELPFVTARDEATLGHILGLLGGGA
ncbi:inositol monophosphatase family protein [Streptomyces smaragdinus]|uniref:inositol monophosphatase family protein n=1 Tax=Streptomyces smaragdinus TaxID=2585196 RepID=UPI002B209B4F|nr:inositol monophosphatase family protein [Streptomyces smaragdinus]